MKIQKGDMVIIRTGKDKGKTGTVTRTHPDLNKVEVDGINVVKRHVKPTRQQPKGGIVEVSAPIHVSNVGLVHPEDGDRAARVGYSFKGNNKVRVYRQANEKEVS